MIHAGPRQVPQAAAPEIVLSGRSNAGKSTLLNEILGASAGWLRFGSRMFRTFVPRPFFRLPSELDDSARCEWPEESRSDIRQGWVNSNPQLVSHRLWWAYRFLRYIATFFLHLFLVGIYRLYRLYRCMRWTSNWGWAGNGVRLGAGSGDDETSELTRRGQGPGLQSQLHGAVAPQKVSEMLATKMQERERESSFVSYTRRHSYKNIYIRMYTRF